MFKKTFKTLKDKLFNAGRKVPAPKAELAVKAPTVTEVKMPRTPPMKTLKQRLHDAIYSKNPLISLPARGKWNTATIRFMLGAKLVRPKPVSPGKNRLARVKELAVREMFPLRRQRVEMHVNAVREKNREAGKNRYGHPIYGPRTASAGGLE